MSALAKLADALDEAERARRCITQNRGFDREQAREGYEYFVGAELVPAMVAALEDGIGDIEARKVERIARSLLKQLAGAQP